MAKTVPLLNCPGQAGTRPLPELRIRIGQQILLSGIKSDYYVTVRPSGLLRRRGMTYTAVRFGRILFVIHRYPFCSAPTGPNACPLLKVTVSQS